MVNKAEADENKIVLFSAKKTEQVVQKDKEVQSTIEKKDENATTVYGFKATEEPKEKPDGVEIEKTESAQVDNPGVVATEKSSETNSFKVNEQSFVESETGKTNIDTQEKAKETEPISEQKYLNLRCLKSLQRSSNVHNCCVRKTVFVFSIAYRNTRVLHPRLYKKLPPILIMIY